jgi:hypothetical protein
MGNRSTVEQLLSAEDRQALDRRILSGDYRSESELLDWANRHIKPEAAPRRISKSSLNRHALKLKANAGVLPLEDRAPAAAMASEAIAQEFFALVLQEREIHQRKEALIIESQFRRQALVPEKEKPR